MMQLHEELLFVSALIAISAEVAMPNEKKIENYRAEQALRFKREYQETEAQLASLKTKHLELEAILKRLQTKPPSDACYRCYYENGVIASIRGVPFDPATPKIDRFRCANGHYF
jgi:hypothetical protein